MLLGTFSDPPELELRSDSCETELNEWDVSFLEYTKENELSCLDPLSRPGDSDVQLTRRRAEEEIVRLLFMSSLSPSVRDKLAGIGCDMEQEKPRVIFDTIRLNFMGWVQELEASRKARAQELEASLIG